MEVGNEGRKEGKGEDREPQTDKDWHSRQSTERASIRWQRETELFIFYVVLVSETWTSRRTSRMGGKARYHASVSSDAGDDEAAIIFLLHGDELGVMVGSGGW